MHYITTHDMPRNRKEWQLLPVNEQIIFIQFAQQMEALGILVAELLININLVDKTIGSLVTIGWENYKIMTLDSREKTTDPFPGEYFQWLAEQMDKRMKENPRKPVYEKSK